MFRFLKKSFVTAPIAGFLSFTFIWLAILSNIVYCVDPSGRPSLELFHYSSHNSHPISLSDRMNHQSIFQTSVAENDIDSCYDISFSVEFLGQSTHTTKDVSKIKIPTRSINPPMHIFPKQSFICGFYFKTPPKYLESAESLQTTILLI